MFGLGSSEYPAFNAVAKEVDALLEGQGAKRMFPAVCGDEITGKSVQNIFPDLIICSMPNDFEKFSQRLFTYL